MSSFKHKTQALAILILCLTLPVLAYPASTQLIYGKTASSSRWGSGWLDLATVTDFSVGERFRLTIGGTAKKILVRFLGKGQSPDLASGIVGGIITVPENRIVEFELQVNRKAIVQISVHGGSNPWHYLLGAGNGPATIEVAYLIRK